MLLTVTYRKENTYPFTHIWEVGQDNTFCGDFIPGNFKEPGAVEDPRNPYIGKNNVSCQGCITEFQNGRRTGHRLETSDPSSIPSMET